MPDETSRVTEAVVVVNLDEFDDGQELLVGAYRA